MSGTVQYDTPSADAPLLAAHTEQSDGTPIDYGSSGYKRRGSYADDYEPPIDGFGAAAVKITSRPVLIAKASVPASYVNLTNTILGAGMLGLPYAFAECGIVFGIVLLFLGACGGGFGLHLLNCLSADLNGEESSYYAIAQATLPRVRVVVDAAVAIKCFGVATSYLIIMGTLMPRIVESIDDTVSDSSVLLDRRLWVGLTLLVVGPLSYMRSLHALRYTSFIALIAVAYLVVLIIVYYADPSLNPSHGRLNWHDASFKIFKAVPVFVFSFTCHQNLPLIYNEIVEPKKTSTNATIAMSVATVLTLYLVVSNVGYFTWGFQIADNIIDNYPTTAPVTVARVALALLILFSYPLQAHPCRFSIQKVIWGTAPTVYDADEDDSRILFTVRGAGYSRDWLVHQCKHYGITTVLLIGTFCIAFAVKDLTVVLAVVGATGSTTIVYILPGAFYVKMHENDGWPPKRCAALVMVGLGFFIMVSALTFIFLPKEDY